MTGHLPTLTDVRSAERRIAGRIRRTPLWRTDIDGPDRRLPVWLKLEQLQISGSFKARGAFNTVLRLAEAGTLPRSGLVIASGGNAGIAATLAGRLVGATVTVFVPSATPTAKADRLRELGAVVIDGGPTHVDTHHAVQNFVATTGAGALHPYNTFDMIAGAGTLALELEQVDHGPVVVAVGGGGLIGGVATVGQATGFDVVAVEPTGAASLHGALAAGHPVPVEIDTVAVDSLGATTIGELAFAVAERGRIVSVLVSDSDILAGRSYLWDRYRLAVENSAGAVVGALLSGRWRPDPEEPPPVLVLCGANLDDPHRNRTAAATTIEQRST